MDPYKSKLIAFWWGRTLPKQYYYLRNLSKLSDDQLEELEKLKGIFEKAEAEGINLGWGHQVKRSEICLE